MKQIIKYSILIVIAVSFAIYILHDFLVEKEIIYYIFVAVIIFGMDTFTKWTYNKYIISIFVPDKIPIPNYVRNISNGFISIAAIITGYQIGIGFNPDLYKTFNPTVERLENDKIFIAILFFILVSVFLYIAYAIAYTIRIETKKIDLNLLKKVIMKKIVSTPFLIIIIVLIIMFIPWILTRESILPSFVGKGEIGDTIGGLTAPFLNGIAAILIFITFKAQNRANEILKEQYDYDKIYGLIDRISDKNIDLNIYLTDLKTFHTAILSNTTYNINDYVSLLNKTLYFSTDFTICLELIETYNQEKRLLWKRLYYLYAIYYRDSFINIHKELNSVLGKTNNDKYIADIMLQVQKLNEQIIDVNKY